MCELVNIEVCESSLNTGRRNRRRLLMVIVVVVAVAVAVAVGPVEVRTIFRRSVVRVEAPAVCSAVVRTVAGTAVDRVVRPVCKRPYDDAPHDESQRDAGNRHTPRGIGQPTGTEVVSFRRPGCGNHCGSKHNQTGTCR